MAEIPYINRSSPPLEEVCGRSICQHAVFWGWHLRACLDTSINTNTATLWWRMPTCSRHPWCMRSDTIRLWPALRPNQFSELRQGHFRQSNITHLLGHRFWKGLSHLAIPPRSRKQRSRATSGCEVSLDTGTRHSKKSQCGVGVLRTGGGKGLWLCRYALHEENREKLWVLEHREICRRGVEVEESGRGQDDDYWQGKFARGLIQLAALDCGPSARYARFFQPGRHSQRRMWYIQELDSYLWS